MEEFATELQSTDFSGQALNRKGIVAAVFLASWCSFCRRFRPLFEAAAADGRTTWAVVDVTDDENELWEKFGIEVVPTIVIFKDGQVIWRKDGVLGRGLSEADIQEAIRQIRLAG